jgi:methylated-DNA-protein-cysteine methyltransferase-like protein
VTADSYKRIYSVVREIPRGRVATYGQVARLAGLGGQARQVGYALSALNAEQDVPWHRVINSRGEISRRSEPGMEQVQKALLEKEGIIFEGGSRIQLHDYQWQR